MNRLRALAARLLLALLAPLLLLGGIEGGLRLIRFGLPTRFLLPVEIEGKAA